MPNRLIFFILFLFALSAQAQDSIDSESSAEPMYIKDRLTIELHNDLFLDTPEGMEVRPWSPGVNAYVMYDYNLIKNVVSFAWGYGFSSFNVHLNGNFERDTLTSSEFVRFEPFGDNYGWEKHKLSANFLEIPVEFRLRTRGRTPFKISLGGKVGYLVNIHTKTIDDDGKRKLYQVPEINRWRYGLYGKIGLGRLSLSGFYSLSTFLNEGEGVELIPLTIGLSIALL